MVCKTITLETQGVQIPLFPQVKHKIMSNKKLEKKRTRLKERIATMEVELIEALTKKTSTIKEIDVPSYTREINEMKLELQGLK